MRLKKYHLSPPVSHSGGSSTRHHPFADFRDEERWNRNKAIASLCLVQCLFGIGTVFVKWTLKSTSVKPITLLLHREVSAAIILVLLSSRHGWPLRKHFKEFLVAGFCMFLNQALFIVGVDLSGALVASCIQPSQPIVTFAIAVLVGQEKIDSKRCVGLGFAVVGAVAVVLGDVLVTGKSAAEVGKNSLLGDVCLIANCLAMGFCYVLVKELNKWYSSIVVIAWIYAYAALFLVMTAPFFLSERTEWLLPKQAIPAYLYLVLVISVMSYVVISWSNRHLDSSQVSSFTCLQPVVGALGACLLLSEVPTLGEALGGVMIVLGLLLTVSSSSSSSSRK